LHRSDGKNQEEVADLVKVNRPVVVKWEKRFKRDGIQGLNEAKRSGRKPWIDTEVTARIISKAATPPPGRTRWSRRTMARAEGVSADTVGRIWEANDIKPHVKRTFKLSNDKQFEVKFWDVIGLYLNPPDRALVLCCDEKSGCQALERTQPGLPLGMGHIQTATHDYVRHGTVTLFAALNYADGKIFHQTAPRHTHTQWLAFLKGLHNDSPEGLTLHIILDNYATHKHAKVRSWIKWLNQRHQKTHGQLRIVLHFTPTSSSWMNMVERFFRDLTVDCVRDGSFSSVKELVSAMEAYLAERQLNPKRYVWRAKGEEILAKIKRAREALQKRLNQNYE
jgi:transposase